MGKVLERWGHLGTTEYICATCSKAFSVVTCFDTKKHAGANRFCKKRCWYDWKKINVTAWNKGKTKLTDARLDYERPTQIKKGQRLSTSTEFKKGDKVGAKNNLWKGGITPLNSSIRTSTTYKAWRRNVFMRDDFTCQSCGVRGEELHVDHKRPFALIAKDFISNFSQFSPLEDKQTLLRLADSYMPFWDLNNGQTLCVDCHKDTPSYLVRDYQEAA